MTTLVDPKTRFTDRVRDYVRYRPGYPRAALDFLAREADLGPERAVADVGSGTGILTRMLLDTGATVFAVEPNAAMRTAAEQALGEETKFVSVNASAEETGLAASSVDLVTAAQAFHWFDADKTRAELARIGKPGSLVALIWNQRKDTPFNLDYEAMLDRYAPDYANVRERDRAAEPKIAAFYAPAPAICARFDNAQRLDAKGLAGRLTSSSYAPKAGDASYEAILTELAFLFARHERHGQVTIEYETIVWTGCLHG